MVDRDGLPGASRGPGSGGTIARLFGSQGGFGFVAALFALLILAALYFGYFDFSRGARERSTGVTAIDRSRDFACRTNRQTIERELTMWQASHDGAAPSLDALGGSRSQPKCPEGGSYSLSGGHVHCSLHP